MFANDETQDGWELVENTETEIVPISDLEIVPLTFTEEFMSGEEMKEVAKELGADLGQNQAEYLLEHQAEIPEEWKRGKLFFPGTVWVSAFGKGSRFVPYLVVGCGKVRLEFQYLKDCWHSREAGRLFLLRPRK